MYNSLYKVRCTSKSIILCTNSTVQQRLNLCVQIPLYSRKYFSVLQWKQLCVQSPLYYRKYNSVYKVHCIIVNTTLCTKSSVLQKIQRCVQSPLYNSEQKLCVQSPLYYSKNNSVYKVHCITENTTLCTKSIVFQRK